MEDNFTENKILSSSDLIGQELKIRRIEKKQELETVSKKIKINIKYLEAIESGKFEKLPKGVYGKNFIREYAIFLGIDSKTMLDLYKSEFVVKDKNYIKNLFVKKVSKTHHFLTIPRIIKNSILILVIIVCVGYLGYYINNIITPPELELINLTEDRTITSHVFTIKGKTKKEVDITINNELVLIDGEGNFEKEITLKRGLNVVSVTAQRKYSKKRIIKRNIIVK